MTSTQKFSGFSVVPWYNSSEWKKVFSLIIDESGNLEMYQEAFDTISLWQIRMPLLPSGIEGTLCILEGLLADEKSLTERNYSIFCASSIMRFLNICVASRAQVMNFSRTVRQNSIPSWIVNIRHDFAHSHKLPKPELLRLALKESYRWLKENYWQQEFVNIKDYIKSDSRRVDLGVPNYNLSRLITFYGNLLVYTVKDLPLDDYVQEEVDNYEIVKTDRIEILNEILSKMYESATYNKGNCDYIIDEILNTNCFNLNPSNLSDSCFKCFTNLLIFVQQYKCIGKLVLELGNTVHDDMEVLVNRQAAAEWLDEIFHAILKFHGHSSKAKWKFNEFCNDDLNQIKDLKFFLLKSLDSLSKSFYNSFLELMNVGSLSENSKFSKDLEKAMSRKFYQNVISEIDDSRDVFEQLKDSQLNLVGIVPAEEEVVQVVSKKPKRWTVVDNTAAFESCPIGKLPLGIF